MSGQFKAECPECGETEFFGITPTINLGVRISAEVTVTDCSNCSYSE